ncbi:MAG: DUF4176 domain-containing protein [Erysipelotrichaceae bacterium]|nr:DUF4176 domain-containing protein [Erysipelotrichaceae bacterium]
MYKNLLPVGSVVLLKDGDKRLMICGRIQAKAKEDTIYDYSACLYPEGIISADAMYFFNRDAIEMVYFIGFQDLEEIEFRHKILGSLDDLEIKEGKIIPKQ